MPDGNFRERRLPFVHNEIFENVITEKWDVEYKNNLDNPYGPSHKPKESDEKKKGKDKIGLGIDI